jgi:hypothetical protein
MQYIVFLDLPHAFSSSHPPLPTQQEIYQCNCTVCYKMSFFHVNPPNSRDDFMLLSPLDPDRELSIYECNSKIQNYYFCPTYRVRCFTFSSVGKIDVMDFTELGKDKEGKREI